MVKAPGILVVLAFLMLETGLPVLKIAAFGTSYTNPP
jgi:hypothetical protein